MYNEVRKRQYIEEKRKYAVLSNNIIDAFKTAEVREEKYNRDLCEWNSSEIIDYYKWLSTPYVQTLIQLHTSLTEYTNWCVSNNLVSDNQNHFTEITTQLLCECIDLNRFKKFILSREKILDDIVSLPNESDKFIVLGLFEGITMKDKNMTSIRLSDFNGNIVTLQNGNKLNVSDELKIIAHGADEETVYISLSNKQTRETPYEAGHHTIIKPISAKRGVIRDKTLMIGNRLRKIVKFLGWEEGTTIKTIIESGRIDFIKRYSEVNNIPAKDLAVLAKYRPIHEDIYGMIQNGITYMYTYGLFI